MLISSTSSYNWAQTVSKKRDPLLEAVNATGSITSNSATDSSSSSSSSNASSSVGASASLGSGDSTIDQFKAYMKETPAQKMQDAWLARHGLTRAQFEAMDDTQKQKIVDQMQHDLKQQAQAQTQTQQQPTNILA